MCDKKEMPETPVIRPPSEWRSLLLRLTRGCKWNRCRFCGIYPHLGANDFSIRTVAEVKHDIDLLRQCRSACFDTAFIGDADPLQAGVAAFCEIASYLRRKFTIKRLTCYARASTLYKLKQDSITRLGACGLDRVHIGLESGDDATLRFHKKGQTAPMVRQATIWLKQAGIEVSFYVLLGLGGRDRWQQHIRATARLINATGPEFVRIRRLWLYSNNSLVDSPPCPLWHEIRAGTFIPQTPEGTVLELKLLLEHLQSPTTFVACDHENNFVQVSGTVREDKEEMLAEIDAFLAQPPAERQAHYRAVGGRI
jgi:radical SAM superfamily enzyme YgiQ (UPF0313 family)